MSDFVVARWCGRLWLLAEESRRIAERAAGHPRRRLLSVSPSSFCTLSLFLVDADDDQRTLPRSTTVSVSLSLSFYLSCSLFSPVLCVPKIDSPLSFPPSLFLSFYYAASRKKSVRLAPRLASLTSFLLLSRVCSLCSLLSSPRGPRRNATQKAVNVCDGGL